MNHFLIGTLVAMGCCILLNLYLHWSAVKEPPLYHDSVEGRIKFTLSRARYNRTALATYHAELCQIYEVDPNSHIGDILAEVIFDGADFDKEIGMPVGETEV